MLLSSFIKKMSAPEFIVLRYSLICGWTAMTFLSSLLALLPRYRLAVALKFEQRMKTDSAQPRQVWISSRYSTKSSSLTREKKTPPCNYSRNRLLSIHMSQRKSTLHADLLNNRPKVTLKGHIGALIYILYKWFYLITGYFISGFYCIDYS